MAAIEKVFITTNRERPCMVDNRRAVFHRWIDNARPAKPRGYDDDEEMEYFQLYSVKALVEFEDGTVRHVWPNEIKFLDSAERFAEYEWDSREPQLAALPFGDL